MTFTIKIDTSKTIEENAQSYFEKAKKARKKLSGLEVAMQRMKKKAEKEAANQELEKQQSQERVPKRSLHWYEKFRWFITSDGFLCIGGRDAATNEIIIKKHTQPGDLVFHTDMAGSPFMVIKADSVKEKEISEQAIEEVAQFTASMSRAWKNGLRTLDTFYVNQDQVSKEAQAGEFLGKGSFMIRGKTTYLHPTIELFVCQCKDGSIMSAPLSACKEHAEGNIIIEIKQGKGKVSDAAKAIKKKLPNGNVLDLDMIIRALPAGDVVVKGVVKHQQ